MRRKRQPHSPQINHCLIFLFDPKNTGSLVTRLGYKARPNVSSGIWKLATSVKKTTSWGVPWEISEVSQNSFFRPPLNRSYTNELLLTYHFTLLPKQFTELPIFGVTIISTRHFTMASQEKNNHKKERT